MKKIFTFFSLVSLMLILGANSALADTTIFSFSNPTATTKDGVAAGTSYVITSSNATIEGGTVTFINDNNKAASAISAGSGTTGITFGSGKHYVKIELTTALAKGDVISHNSTSSNGNEELQFNTEKAAGTASSSQRYTIPQGSGLIGATTIYVCRNQNTTRVSSLTITRATSDTRTATAAPSISYESTATSATVTIKNNETTAAGNIYYTTDGSTPTASSTKYTSSFDITQSCTIKAIFIPTDGSAYKESSVASEKIDVMEPLNVQSYTASGNWTMGTSDIDAGSQLVNKNIQVFTTYTAKTVNQAFTIQGTEYQYYTNVRVDKMNADGSYTEKEGSTALTIKCGKNGVFMVKYRRQNDNSGTPHSYTPEDGKDIHLSEAGGNTRISGEWEMSGEYTDGDNAGKFAWGVKQWNLEAGKEYVLWATGTTVPVFGFSFFPDHTVNKFTPGDEGYSTMCLDYDAVIPEGVEAYKGSLNNNVLTLSAIEGVVPANTPVVLKGKESVTFKKQLSVAEKVQDNDLQGCIGSKATSTVEGGTVCVLGYVDEQAGFYKYTGDNLGANKAYLVVPAQYAAKGIEISLGNEGATANDAVQAATEAVVNGKFVENGKLVIVKAGKKYNAAGIEK